MLSGNLFMILKIYHMNSCLLPFQSKDHFRSSAYCLTPALQHLPASAPACLVSLRNPALCPSRRTRHKIFRSARASNRIFVGLMLTLLHLQHNRHLCSFSTTTTTTKILVPSTSSSSCASPLLPCLSSSPPIPALLHALHPSTHASSLPTTAAARPAAARLRLFY